MNNCIEKVTQDNEIETNNKCKALKEEFSMDFWLVTIILLLGLLAKLFGVYEWVLFDGTDYSFTLGLFNLLYTLMVLIYILIGVVFLMFSGIFSMILFAVRDQNIEEEELHRYRYFMIISCIIALLLITGLIIAWILFSQDLVLVGAVLGLYSWISLITVNILIKRSLGIEFDDFEEEDARKITKDIEGDE